MLLLFQVWPYLLGLYEVKSTPTQRTLALGKLQEHYDTTLKSWVVVENAIKESKAEEFEECEQLFADLPSRNEQIQAMWEFRETIRRNRKLKEASSSPPSAASPEHEDHASSSSDTSPKRVPSPTPVLKTSRGRRAPVSVGNTAVLDLDNESDNCCTCERQDTDIHSALMDERPDSSATLGLVPEVPSTVITYRVCPVCGKSQRQQRNSQSETPMNGLATPPNGLDADEVDRGSDAGQTKQGTHFTVSQLIMSS